MRNHLARKPVVRVLLAGAALTVGVAACTKDPGPTHNPPPLPPEPVTTTNPPVPEVPVPVATALPTWDEVQSGHPEGATNPPMPVLEVNEAGDACAKAWFDPRAVPPEARQKGGVVLAAGEAPTGTPVQCPADQVAEVLARHAEVEGDTPPPVGDSPAEGGE